MASAQDMCTLTRQLGVDPEPADEDCNRDALAELYEQHGTPLVSARVNGSRVVVWELYPDGDGIAKARMSTDEDNGGMTIDTQVERLLRFTEAQGLRPRWL